MIFRRKHLSKVKIFFKEFFKPIPLENIFLQNINCVNSLKLEIIFFLRSSSTNHR
jgi:hypothetical protein